MIPPCFRGEVYYAVLGRGVGSEQAGTRPVVILQNDVGNKFSPTTIIAPISKQTETKASLPTHYYLEAVEGLTYPSIVLLGQIRVIDKARLGERLGRLTAQHMWEIDKALEISVGLHKAPSGLVLCLCSACANQFYGTGAYSLRRLDPLQVEKDMCTYCSRRTGFDYEVISRSASKTRSNRVTP